MQQFINYIKQSYSLDSILEYINKIKDISILIIGEPIIDKYVFGHTLGKSGKFPIVAFEIESEEEYRGGTLAIYNHLKTYTNNIDLLINNLAIRKTRYIQDNQKLFETYDSVDVYKYIIGDNFISTLDRKLDYDMILIADYGHGFITKDIRKIIKDSGIFTCLNTQFNAGNEGLNTIRKYDYYANYICIDEHELRLAFSNVEDTIGDILKYWTDKNIIISITMGHNGSIIKKDNILKQYPSLQTNIIDTIGAGDAYLSLTSPMAYLNAPIDIIALIGNSAGGIACTYQGNKSYVSKDKLMSFIKQIIGD